ncbi:hypothetical protein FQN57_002809 [Myotisia sp. PD_48]|nr:hypothetical protein FQN57_002809 [Myotisia sp. PD_48]
MAPPSPLAIATSAVKRLVKEEAFHHKEIQNQKKRIEALEKEAAAGGPEEEGMEGNREYTLNQERQVLQETEKVLPGVKAKISEALETLKHLITEEGEKGLESNVSQITAAKEAVAQAMTATREIS